MKILSLPLLISALSSVLAVAAPSAPPPELPVATFFKKPSLTSLTFSPDGKRIACLIPYERRMNLAVIDLEKKTKNLLTNFKDNDVGSVRWASNERLIFTKDEDGKEYAAVYAVSRDGTGPLQLAGYDSTAGTSAVNIRFGGFLARLPKDPNHYLVEGYMTGAQGPDVCLMDLKSGRMSVLMPNPGFVKEWFLDHEQRVRMAVSVEGQVERVLLRDENKGEWEIISTRQTDEHGWSPVAFDGDNQTLFISSNLGRDTEAIFRYDIATRRIGEMVFGDETYDVDGVVYDDVRKRVTGVRYNADRNRVHWIDPEVAAFQKRIDASLPDTSNFLRAASPDGSKQLIFSTSDRDPGIYYLYDTAKKKIEELAVLKPGIDPERMAAMQPITFKSRDGLTIHGYLTMPAGRDGKNLPMVLHPHGGPYGFRDDWMYNPEVQFYANRGYVVLQVNYRGSGGYGYTFERAGYKKWGLEMQDDLTDAVNWAITQGIADPARVVISGASYGGYATMAGLTFTPELYCAGINYVGVVDIEELIPRGERATSERRYWYSTRIADLSNAADRKRVHDTSPVNFADRIRAPLLMAYGKNDPRVRIVQGYDMEAALKKAGKSYEMIIQRDEGHGFYKEELSIAFYTKVDEFLKKHVPSKANVSVVPAKVIDVPAKPGT